MNKKNKGMNEGNEEASFNHYSNLVPIFLDIFADSDMQLMFLTTKWMKNEWMNEWINGSVFQR